tara:strand:+ start:691 stop:1206 length:516 start_codon:yes stop_codon:yes gene_type:complete
MNLPSYNESDKEKLHNLQGEFIRLCNELKSKKSYQIKDVDNNLSTIPAKTDGFDITTCDFNEIKKRILEDKYRSHDEKPYKKHSNSLMGLMLDVCAWRFPDKLSELKRHEKFPKKLKKELDLSISNLKKELSYLGKRGVSGYVRQDGSIKQRNDVHTIISDNYFTVKRKRI